MNRTFLPSLPSVGVELEWQLVDAETFDLRAGITPLAELLADDPCVKPELLQTALETITTPHESTVALRSELRDRVARTVEAAARLGIVLVGAGTHAFSERLIPVTPLPRYLAIEQSQGYLANAYVAYSLQVHVGMPSAEVAIRVMREMRGFVPVLIALASSSPFYRGCSTPFASCRQHILSSSRSSGMPPLFEDWAAFLQFLDVVERAGMFGSYRDIHWGVRLRPDFGTIEVRIMDAQPTLERSIALAALVHSLLVHLASEGPFDPRLVRALPWWLEKENAFRAAHDGVEAELVRDERGTVEPLRRLAEDLFELVAPTARALGEDADLRAVLERPSYQEQRTVYDRTGSTRAVVRALANELLVELGRAPLPEAEAQALSARCRRPDRSSGSGPPCRGRR